MKYVRKMRVVNMLCTLQKNDNWLRFFGNDEGKRFAVARQTARGGFGKSRNPAGSRRTTGLGMNI